MWSANVLVVGLLAYIMCLLYLERPVKGLIIRLGPIQYLIYAYGVL